MNKRNKTEKIYPECSHQFQGKGWDGIDVHWRSKHELIVPYEETWSLLEVDTSGASRRENDRR